MGKHINYFFACVISTLSMIAPLGMIFLIVYLWYTQGHMPKWTVPVECLLICQVFLLKQPFQSWRIKARRTVEYDEFGISKTKGRYEQLSKKERDQIDMQKAADMERLIGSVSLKKMTKSGSLSPQKDIDALIGMDILKTRLKEMEARMKFDKEEMQKNKKQFKSAFSGCHMCFFGSPGTGKTTCARIVTGMLYKYGFIKKNKVIEIDGNFLKAGSESATKTELVMREAYGGVLFIDEAYAIAESADKSGEQIIATLIKHMEDDRNKIVIILAGYKDEMRDLIATNPGFESRIKEYLLFPDYSDDEMFQIAIKMLNELNFKVEEEAKDNFIAVVQRERQLHSFGNARTARNIIDKAIDKHAINIEKYPNDKHRILQPQDFIGISLGGIQWDFAENI